MNLRDIELNSTSRVFRIAHISDTHVSPEYSRQNIFKVKALLSRIVDENYDHIVITGDIAGQGEERDFRSVRRILKYFGLLEHEKLTVTIGNHDIFGGVHRAEDLLSFGKHCRSTDYAAKIDLFERTFKETFPRKAYENERAFPYVKIIGPVVFVGINSVTPFHPLINPFGSNGHVSDRQLQAVERILRHPSVDGFTKIALVHHHFDKYQPYSSSLADKLYHAFEARTLKLHGKKKVQKVFCELGVTGVLHGHTHIEETYSDRGITYSSTAMNPVRSKAEARTAHDASQLCFNEIAVDAKGKIRARMRRISYQETRLTYFRSSKIIREPDPLEQEG